MTFAESDLLHERVRAFARGETRESFEMLALDIARFQRAHSPGFARLVRTRASELETLDDIPGVPTDAFRLTRVAVHDKSADSVRFATSGTTGNASGIHVMRTTETYRTLAVSFGRLALASAWTGPYVVVALAPRLEQPPASSLGYMMRLFMEEFDARPLFQSGPFMTDEAERWLINADGINIRGLRRAAALARERNEPLLVLATSFALVALLDALGDERILAPEHTVIMQTGGFKGRTREVPADELRRAVATVFGIPEKQIVSEYGMTELTSQLYEGCLPGSLLSQRFDSPEPGIYFEPPWLRVTPVDPVSLRKVPDGDVGLAHFIDLGNVDSAIAILTQDRVRRVGGGIELSGRAPGAPPRGCSLAVEAFIMSQS